MGISRNGAGVSRLLVLAAVAAVAVVGVAACGGSDKGGTASPTTTVAQATGAEDPVEEEPAAQDPTEVSSFDLEVGDCLVTPLSEEDGGVGDVEIVTCDQEHESEVFAVFDMEDGDFPGAEAAAAESQDVCTAEFEGFVGLDYNTSELGVNFLYPTEQTWAAGDREIVCLVFDEAGLQTGSLAGAQR